MRAGAGLLLVLALAYSCRNPFNPAAEIELVRMTAQTSFQDEWEILIFSGCCGGAGMINYQEWEVISYFVIKNKVGVTLTNVNIIYTDYQGNPVTLYQNSGGRNFKFIARLSPVAAGPQFDFNEGQQTLIPLFVVDPQVIAEFQAGTLAPQVMFATVTFRGVDDNGYDVKLSGTMTIKAYGPI